LINSGNIGIYIVESMKRVWFYGCIKLWKNKNGKIIRYKKKEKT
jgi:hypothetical protein